MAPSPASNPRGTSSSFSGNGGSTIHRTPTTPRLLRTPLFHHHHFRTPSAGSGATGGDHHPVEVVGRIREHPDGGGPDTKSSLQTLPLPATPSSSSSASSSSAGVRVRTEQGLYRDFTLDGVSLAAAESLQGFYQRYVEPRVDRVRLGARCTVMMYGPTGAGKSHTMFGSKKEPGIAYRALQQILMANPDEGGEEEGGSGSPGYSRARITVNASILEIYNEEVFDLIASAPSTPGLGWLKNNPRVRVEIMGKKVKNITSISGSDAHKITKEIAKVEKRRIVKSTLCNERSSRSHCMVILDVPSVGGKLVLVDMAGSENIDQAGLGSDSKMQTGKINQGNIALKRVVEAIANGDSYIPFRDSKLTMLLQDSFEDDKAKILMILCVSPDVKDTHKTTCTLEYGAKAKCIVRLPISPPATEKSAMSEESEQSVLEARIHAMEEYISKLQEDNRQKEMEKEKMDRELMQREKDLAELREKTGGILEHGKRGQFGSSEDEAKLELERRLAECQKLVDEFVESGKRKLEEQILEQQNEIEWLRSRVEEIEKELSGFKSVDLVRAPSSAKRSASQQSDGEASERRTGVLLSQLEVKNKHRRSSSSSSDSIGMLSNLEEANEEFCKSPRFTFSSPDSFSCDAELSPKILLQHSVNHPETSKPTLNESEDDDDKLERKGWLPMIPESLEEGEDMVMSGREDEEEDDDDDDDDEEEEEEEEEEERHSNKNIITTLYMEEKRRTKEVGERVGSNVSMETPSSLILSTSKSPKICSDSAIEEGHSDKQNGEAVNLITKETLESPASNISTPNKLCSDSARKSRIENIFLLCGNRRELAGSKPATAQDSNSCSTNLPTAEITESPKTHRPQNKSFANKEIRVPDPSMSLDDWLPISQARLLSDSAVPVAPSNARGSPPTKEEVVMTPLPVSPRVGGLLSPTLSRFSLGGACPLEPLKDSSNNNNNNKNDSQSSKENLLTNDAEKCDVYVKWETLQNTSGKIIRSVKMGKGASLADLRRTIEAFIPDDKRDFTFLMLRDPSGAAVEREKELMMVVSSLPDFQSRGGSKLACLRVPVKRNLTLHHLGGGGLPFSSLENRLTPPPSPSYLLSPKLSSNNNNNNQSPCPSPKAGVMKLHNSNLATTTTPSGHQVRGLLRL